MNGSPGRRALVSAAVVALLAASAPLVLPVPTAAAAPASEAYPVPDGGSFALSGLGYGHGIGMSQFGAEGMGRQGKSHREILDFYYPGTTRETVDADHTIRVSLSSMTRREAGTSTVTVVPRAGLSARADSGSLTLPLTVGGETVDSYRVLRTRAGLSVRAYAGGSSEKVVSGLDGAVRFQTAVSRARSKVSLVSGSGSARSYRGHIVVRRSPSGLLVVDDLVLEHYLRAVVSLEISGGWTPAALRAQAVAARSYALLIQRNARAAGRRFDICDTTSCQVFGSIATESANEVKAVRATAGEYLASGGEPAFTQFSSANGGYSVAGSRSYLVARPDPYDGVVAAADNWGHSWQRTVTARAIESAWPAIGTLRTLKVLGRDGNGAWGGRVQSLALVGSAATVTVSGDSFRWAVGLKSTWWTVTNAGSAQEAAAPRAVRGVPLDRSLRVAWKPPRTDLAVKRYVVIVQPGAVTRGVSADRRRLRIGGLVNGVEYSARVAAVYPSGRGARAGTGTLVPTSPESYFRPVSSTRLWSGTEVAALSDGGAVTVPAAGTDRVPLAGTRAVLLRVSAGGSERGSAVAWRTGADGDRLTAASFARGDDATGTISVPVSRKGRVTLGTTAPARFLTVDVVGYYTVSGVRSWQFRATPATQVADSRAGMGLPRGRIDADDTAWVKVAGRQGLPDSGVRAVLVNASLVAPRQDARLSLARPDQPFASGMAVRSRAGDRRAATAVVRLDDRGRIPLRLSAGRSHVVVDVLGWFGAQDGTAAGRYRASSGLLLDPGRDGPMGDGEVTRLAAAGTGDVPADARSVLLLVRAFGAQSSGFVDLRPAGASGPLRASVVFDQRGPTRNLVAVPMGDGGDIEVAVAGDAADVTVRVVGWYS